MTIHAESHTFELRDMGDHQEWWCNVENVVSEQCTDYSRCENQCYCNKVQVIIDDEIGYTEDTLPLADLPPEAYIAFFENNQERTVWEAEDGTWEIGWDLGIS